MIEQIALKFSWIHPVLFYEKMFWEDELLESGFCKMMVTVRCFQFREISWLKMVFTMGLFVRASNKQSNLKPNPRILSNDRLSGTAMRSLLRQALGLFVRASNKQSNLKPNPRILPNDRLSGTAMRSLLRQALVDNVGTDRAGWFIFEA
ncbi:unnamed protein product [Gongylonema pulchrum]|uniref:RUN domain-containing protein n=1 Tax=Gongylonema pulchrum TaxID=637853 RepID=A0A183E5B7_9BILA|nr:unnamed protein product [Gongylonema pulchrum]